jgi:hypothetical protein
MFMTIDQGARKRAQKAKKIALGNTFKTISISSVVKAMDSNTKIDSTVNSIRVRSYYDDNLDSNAGALWTRALVQSNGPGKRVFSDGSYWEISESVIDAPMLGARAIDRTTDSTLAIQECIAVGLGSDGTGYVSMSGNRKVRLTPPKTKVGYPTLGNAYVVSQELIMTHGLHFEIMAGATLLASSSFSGTAIIASPDNATWQAESVVVQVDGILDAAGYANLCIFPRTAMRWRIYGNGKLINGIKGGFQLGSSSTSYPPFECYIGPLHIEGPSVTTYSAAQTANDPSSIGLWMNRCTDSDCSNIIIKGYRIGYRDDGGNNNARSIHVYTAGSGSNTAGTFYGPMVHGFYLNGSACKLDDIYTDTPTSMGNTSITDVYGITFGTNSSGVVVDRFKVLLNYDNLSRTDTYSSGICSIINHLSNNTDNSINWVDVRTVSTTNVKAKQFITGSGYGRLARSNVQSSVSYTSGNGDLAYERPSSRTKLNANRIKLFTRNSALQVWQRGSSSISATAAATRIFGPDRWFLISDGSGGGRSIQQIPITPTEAFNFQILKPPYAARITRTGVGTSETYFRLEQALPASMLQAMQGSYFTITFVMRLFSGSFTGSIKAGFEQNFGSGGSATVLTEGVILTGSSSLSANYSQWNYPIGIPSVSGKTIGTGAFLGIYISLPIDAAHVLDITQIAVTDGFENIIYQIPDIATETNDARLSYEACSVYAPSTTAFWVPFKATKESTPTVNVTNGTASNITVDGFTITPTASGLCTYTADCLS